MVINLRTVRVAATVFVLYCMCIAVAGLLAYPEKSDIAVVLGNEVYAGGAPSEALQARLDEGIDIYRRHLAGIIIVSGGVGKSGYNEATVMARYLREHAIPENKIIIDTAGVNTRATAINTGRIMKEKHFHSAIIVSQYYHLPRCILAFHQAGISHFHATYPARFFPRDILALMREAAALPVYWIGGK